MRAELVRPASPGLSLSIAVAVVQSNCASKTIASSSPPNRLHRQGWEEILRTAGSAEPDELLLKTVPPNQFDRDEWKW